MVFRTKYLLILTAFVVVASCNDQAKNAKSRSDRDRVQTTSTDSTKNPQGDTLRSEVKLSEGLKKKGLELGKTSIQSSDTAATDHVLSAYMIFNKNFNDTVRVTVTDRDGLEYGRLHKALKRNAGDAGFVQFMFTSKTDIDARSHILIQSY